MNEDFALRPTAEAALTAICSGLSESNRNIAGLIARWTKRIFSDNKSNLVVNDVDKIAKRTVLVTELGAIAKRGVVVSEGGVVAMQHGVVSKRRVVTVQNCVISNQRGIVAKLGIDERAPSGARVLQGSMESLAIGMALLPKVGIVVIVLLPSTTV